MRAPTSVRRTQNGNTPRRPPPFRWRLVVMAKLPVAGRVKTRLARQIGTGNALRVYRAMTRTALTRVGGQPFWTTYLAITPDAGVTTRMLPRQCQRVPQGGGDLGARMHRPMRRLPPGPVCIIGTDIPGIRIADIRTAFQKLGRHDAVFGPAEDGGFWLVGMRRRPRVIFPYAGVRWSRDDTLAAVEANLSGVSIDRTARLADVDDVAGLLRAQGTIGRLISSR